MYNIAIIGAGQLGSRHLQGLKTAQLPMHIWVVDSSIASLDMARERYEQVDANLHIDGIDFSTSIDFLPNDLDLVIIATSSGPRQVIIEELLRLKSVRNLVLEKVLFSSIDQYAKVTKLLEDNNLLECTWVNCPMRMFSGYHELKNLLRGHDEPIHFSVIGSTWGLACNSIHYVDLFAYLFDSYDIRFDCSGLDNVVHASKRAGYVEFTGTLKATTLHGDKLTILSANDSIYDDIIIEIKGSGNNIVIQELKGTIEINNQIIELDACYQSQMTGEVAEHILQQGECLLTPFTLSSNLHIAFLKALVPFYNNLSGKQGDSCPIT